VLRELKYCFQNKIKHKVLAKNKIFKTEETRKNMKNNIFFASLKSLKKGVGSGFGSRSGSISHRYESADPDSHQNVTDPQHCRTNESGIHKTVPVTEKPEIRNQKPEFINQNTRSHS
jgi:hypothetical protein